jgi:hypothetical protein
MKVLDHTPAEALQADKEAREVHAKPHKRHGGTKNSHHEKHSLQGKHGKTHGEIFLQFSPNVV